jgi:hypothetical protein
VLAGAAIRVRFQPELSAGARKIYSNRKYGQPVFAASFIRRREIVLDQELQDKPKELARILTHELFHFAWVRLGNPTRRSWADLLREELKKRRRGELGWSAEMRKNALSHRLPATRHPKFRDYACESFCDTAAWVYSGIRDHREFTLADRHRRHREEWFTANFGDRRIPI